MRRFAVRCFLFLFLALLTAGQIQSIAQTVDAYVGTWTLNVAKSKFDGPALTSRTLKIEPLPDGSFQQTFDDVNADGSDRHAEMKFRFDGKDYPFQTPTMTRAFKRLSDHSYELVEKVNGEVTVLRSVVVSRDGKTYTMTQTAMQNGKPVLTATYVYDRP